jgi:hypothetical protein
VYVNNKDEEGMHNIKKPGALLIVLRINEQIAIIIFPGGYLFLSMAMAKNPQVCKISCEYSNKGNK